MHACSQPAAEDGQCNRTGRCARHINKGQRSCDTGLVRSSDGAMSRRSRGGPKSLIVFDPGQPLKPSGGLTCPSFACQIMYETGNLPRSFEGILLPDGESTFRFTLAMSVSAARRASVVSTRRSRARASTPTQTSFKSRSGSYVLFLGDSHTEGTYGCNWVDLLTPGLAEQGATVVAAGISGQCSDTIAGRLPGLLDQHGPPAAAVILAGTNNTIAASHPFYQAFYTITGLSRRSKLDLDVYAADLMGMVQLLQQRAPSCQVFLVTIPPLCENPKHQIWSAVLQHNDIVKGVAAQFKESVAVVDFNATCQDYLQQHAATQQPPQPSFYLDLPVVLSVGSAVVMVLKHKVLRQSWDSIAADRGRRLLHDDIHLNDTAGHLLAQQLRPLLQGVLSHKSVGKG